MSNDEMELALKEIERFQKESIEYREDLERKIDLLMQEKRKETEDLKKLYADQTVREKEQTAQEYEGFLKGLDEEYERARSRAERQTETLQKRQGRIETKEENYAQKQRQRTASLKEECGSLSAELSSLQEEYRDLLKRYDDEYQENRQRLSDKMKEYETFHQSRMEEVFLQYQNGISELEDRSAKERSTKIDTEAKLAIDEDRKRIEELSKDTLEGFRRSIEEIRNKYQ